MTTVLLLQRVSLPRGGPAFNIGERVAFEDALAVSLIARGLARAVAMPPVHRMIETAPIAKESKRKGRADVQ